MKKSINTFLTTSLCAILSLSAFTIPTIASIDIKGGDTKVLEKEVPKEYMQDFSAEQGTQIINLNKLLTVIPPSQITEMKSIALNKFKSEYNINVPEIFKFEHKSTNIELPNGETKIKTDLIWSDSTYGAESFSPNSKFFIATFETTNNSNFVIDLISLNIKNVINDNLIDRLAKQGINYLKNNMGVKEKEDFNNLILNTQIVSYFENGNKNMTVSLEWREKKSGFDSGYYIVCFDNVDFINNSSILTGAENFMEIYKQTKEYDFTDTQKNTMLKFAKEFLTKNKIEFGDLHKSPDGSAVRAYQVNQTMSFTFDAQGLNNTNRTFVSIFVDSNMKVLGFLY